MQLVEVASQKLQIEDVTAAGALFAQALALDELHMGAALGSAEALLVQGQLEEAAQQLQFLPELLAASKMAAAPAGASAKELGGGLVVAGTADALDEGLEASSSTAEQRLLYLQVNPSIFETCIMLYT
jgi:thioredoxin-like negative regulator of GroEL